MNESLIKDKPLAGVRVLDMSWLLPGPFCSMMLADLGADVIKIEVPTGDYFRDVMPAAFTLINRGKRSIALDLKAPSGLAVLRDLIGGADVLLEGFRPGVAERLGFGFEAARAMNAGLVYVSISGFGQDGPWSRRPGHDVNYVAAAGGLSIPGQVGVQASRTGLPIGDLAAALYATINILAALRRRDRALEGRGEGAHIDLSIAEAMLHMGQVRFADYLADPIDGRRWRHLFAGSGVFTTADGKRIALGLVEEKFWPPFWQVCGKPVGTEAGRSDEDLTALVEDEIGARNLAFWERAFGSTDVPYSVALEPEEAVCSEHFQQRGVIGRLPGDGPDIVAVAMPGRMIPLDVSAPAPGLGADTASVLAEIGYGGARIASLQREGAVR